jgi:hypothetical protein
VLFHRKTGNDFCGSGHIVCQRNKGQARGCWTIDDLASRIYRYEGSPKLTAPDDSLLRGRPNSHYLVKRVGSLLASGESNDAVEPPLCKASKIRGSRLRKETPIAPTVRKAFVDERYEARSKDEVNLASDEFFTQLIAEFFRNLSRNVYERITHKASPQKNKPT